MTTRDKEITKLLEDVEAKRAALGKKKRRSLRTNGVFKFTKSTHVNPSSFTNINLATEDQLIDAMAFLNRRVADHQQACKDLGLVRTFRWDTYTAEEWKADFQDRIAEMAWEERKEALDKAEAKLKKFTSEDFKIDQELQGLKDLLSAT